MVNRNVEKALYLLCVQVHCQNAAHARGVQQIRHELRRDRHTRLIFAVLTSVSEKWNHRRDPISASAPRCVHHNQELHQMLIGRRTCRLNDEDVVSANVLFDFHVSLTIRKRADDRLTQRDTDVFANPLRQIAVGRAGEDF